MMRHDSLICQVYTVDTGGKHDLLICDMMGHDSVILDMMRHDSLICEVYTVDITL